jgi:hypothetical protein
MGRGVLGRIAKIVDFSGDLDEKTGEKFRLI